MTTHYPTTGPASYLYQRSPDHKHRGLDLAAPEGAPVVAPAAGYVVYVVEPGTRGFRGYGRAVVLETFGAPRWCLFAHLGAVYVVPGQQVARGEYLAQVGRTGVTKSRTHLHFEVAAHPYPMASEAPRLDPVPWLQTHGPVLGAAPSPAAPSPAAPSPAAPSPAAPSPAAPSPAAAIIAAGAALVAVLVARTRRK